MKWYRRGVNPNPILFYRKTSFPLLIFQRWTAQEKSHLFKNHVWHSTSFFFSYFFLFVRCTLAKRWCTHQPVNIYRNCLKRYLICGIILRSIAFLQKLQNKIKKKITVLKCKKKRFFLRKLTKISKLILSFSEISKTFICVPVRQVTFLSEDWKMLSVWSSVLFAASALEMREREAYWKKTRSNVSVLLNKVSALEHDWFMQVSLQTVTWLFANT